MCRKPEGALPVAATVPTEHIVLYYLTAFAAMAGAGKQCSRNTVGWSVDVSYTASAMNYTG